MRILAVWPAHYDLGAYHDLDSRQMYDSGLEYTALRGKEATRLGLVRELQRREYNALEVLTHGEEGQILLSDGRTEAGWWGRLAAEYPLRLVVFLACESSAPHVFNATDALIQAGVESVIAADRLLLAADAVHFASVFYSGLAAGLSVEDAFDRARLVMSRESAEMVRLHGSRGRRGASDPKNGTVAGWNG